MQAGETPACIQTFVREETDARFGGGTLTSMRHGEYRESVDVSYRK